VSLPIRVMVLALMIGGLVAACGSTGPRSHSLTATMQSKTFEIDHSALTTGTGHSTAVSLVQARFDGRAPESGVRTAVGTFLGNPLKWSLVGQWYFADGSINETGGRQGTLKGGGVALTCPVTFTGGSGVFRKATGRATYACTTATLDLAALATCDITGTVSY
jgi:hypothetical protein